MIVEEIRNLDPVFASELVRIIQGTHWDPHQVLGLHEFFDQQKVIRLWRPGAKVIYVEVFGKIMEAKMLHPEGIFELVVPKHTTLFDYRIYHQNGLLSYDPYDFWPSIGELDLYLFNKGVHYHIYQVMGARLIEHQGIKGVRFTVWAPSAMSVSLVADFNFWDGRINPLRSLGSAGIWELFVPGLTEGERYKFEIKTKQGTTLVKADPYALACEQRPKTASIVSDGERYIWHDHEWMEKRKSYNSYTKPMLIYEVHLGSWKAPHDKPLDYRQLAIELGEYCKEMGFTHIELLPVSEHPLDESWGYQVSGFYAVTSRFGNPEDFQFFVDHLHQKGIGVLIDWVPGHFPTDDYSLARFDGSALYEHEDPRQGFHPHWSTYIFNYGRHEVSNFLIGSAIFWLEKMHIDGLRVDAVASMLYLDYGRENGQWIPNQYGGKENLEAIEFFKHLNSVVHQKFPGVLMIAEESTAFAGVTQSVEHNGLGFDYKWNMGWMNDTLRYINKDPIYRRYHHHDLTFGLLYAFSEKFVLVFSHDEVVHGKGSLLSKMPGDLWQKFANMRLLYAYMICQPGKKMMFMGGELGQWSEWWCKEEIHWYLLQYPDHQNIQKLVREINHFYLTHPQMWEKDTDYRGFEWVDLFDVDNSIISYRRKCNPETAKEELLCVHNFTPSTHFNYFLKIPHITFIQEIFNTDDVKYGGSGKHNENISIKIGEDGKAAGCEIIIAPLATQIFQIRY